MHPAMHPCRFFVLTALLCGVGLSIGYSLLGACWLVRKCEGDVREGAYLLIPGLSVALLAFLVVVFAYALLRGAAGDAPMA
jgi:cytochrome bd ubiquinol oxidase subunit II